MLLWLLSSTDDDAIEEKNQQQQRRQGSGSKTGLRQSSPSSSSSSTSNNQPSFDVDKAMAFTDAFTQFVKHTTACTKQITKVSTERGSTSEKDAKLKWRCAMSLRSWYCERMRSRVLNAATILTEQRNLHNSFARSKSGRFSIGSNINKATSGINKMQSKNPSNDVDKYFSLQKTFSYVLSIHPINTSTHYVLLYSLSTPLSCTGKSVEPDVVPVVASSAGDKAPWVNILHKPMRDDGQKQGPKAAVGRYAAAVVSAGSVHSGAADSDYMSHDGTNE